MPVDEPLTLPEKIEKGAAEAREQVFSDFVSSFPAETMSGGFYDVFTRDFSKTSMENIHKLSRLSYGRIFDKWGASRKEYAAYSDLLDAFREFSPGEFIETWEAIRSGDVLGIAEEILDIVQQTWQVVGATGDYLESIPLVGVFVSLAQFGIDTAKSVRNAISSVYYPIEEVRMEYVKQNDESLANIILDRLRDPDWTPIFAPPKFTTWGNHGDARASAIHHANVKWGSGAGQGVVLTLQGGEGFPKLIPTGFGLHPQTTRIPIAWQYHTGDPKKRSTRKDWTYKKGLKRRVDSFEEFHPATQQLSILLWQRLLKNAPEIYRVDAVGIRAAWSTYFKGMEEYLTRKSDDFGLGKTPEYVRPMTRGVIERILSPEYWGNEKAIKETKHTATPDGLITHWEILGKEVPLSYYTDPKKLIMKGIGGEYYDYKWRQSKNSGTVGEMITGGEKLYGLPGPRLTAKGLTQFIIDESLKTRQWNYLNTLTIAYLTPDMPAFQNWPELLDKFHKNREILLKHQARIYVDLDRVPPSGWKNKLINSLKGIPSGLKYTLAGGKIKSAIEGGGGVIPGSEEPVGNALPLIPMATKIPPRDGEGGGGGGLGIAAVAALGVLLMAGKGKRS